MPKIVRLPPSMALFCLLQAQFFRHENPSLLPDKRHKPPPSWRPHLVLSFSAPPFSLPLFHSLLFLPALIHRNGDDESFLSLAINFGGTAARSKMAIRLTK